MNVAQKQRIVRELSPAFLGKQEAVTVFQPTRQNKPSGPSTLAELAEALRNPLPPPPPKPKCYSALEACALYKPLTLEMVRDLMAKEKEARDAILQDYIKRTGQKVEYCDECDLGVVEEEVENGWQTIVEPRDCEACDGLGIVKL